MQQRPISCLSSTVKLDVETAKTDTYKQNILCVSRVAEIYFYSSPADVF